MTTYVRKLSQLEKYINWYAYTGYCGYIVEYFGDVNILAAISAQL